MTFDTLTFTTFFSWLAVIAGSLIALGLIAGAAQKFGVYAWYAFVIIGMGIATVGTGQAPYFYVFMLGMLTAFSEIIGKFPDEPIKSLKTLHALLYHLFNGLIAMFALYVLQLNNVPWENPLDQLKIVVVAGLGSMMVMRSKVFTVKLGGQDVSIGPDQVIKVFLKFMENEIDRVRAHSRIEFVKQTLGNLNPSRITDYSATMLLAAQALEEEKLKGAVTSIASIISDKPDDPQLKSYRLGFLLLNVMGENFVTKLFEKAPADWKIAADLPPKSEGGLARLIPPLFRPDQPVIEYFAYERDMMNDVLCDLLGWPDFDPQEFIAVTDPKTATLADHELVFNAVDAGNVGGLPNILPKAEASVEGVLYTLPKEAAEFLKEKRKAYRRKSLFVSCEGRNESCHVYTARLTDDARKANAKVAEAMLLAAEARGLSSSYIQKLRDIVATVTSE